MKWIYSVVFICASLCLFSIYADDKEAFNSNNNEKTEEQEQKKKIPFLRPGNNENIEIDAPLDAYFFTSSNREFNVFDEFILAAPQRGSKGSTLVRIDKYGQGWPLIQEKIRINNNPLEEINPIYDAKISRMFEAGTDLALTLDDDPDSIYYLERYMGSEHVFHAAGICDGSGKDSAHEIIGLSVGATGTSVQSMNRYIFAAVKNNKGEFGTKNSGIAVVKMDYRFVPKKVKKDEEVKVVTVREPFVNILDAQKGISQGNRACDICFSENQENPISINGGLASIGETIDMFWSRDLERLFVALRVKTDSNAHENQGACAILVGRIKDNQLLFEPIAPHNYFYGSDQVVGATGPNKEIAIHKIRTFKTSANIQYLLVVGDVGSSEKSAKKIYAFPLVDRHYDINDRLQRIEDREIGTLASYASVKDYFYKTFLRSKLLPCAAQKPEEGFSRHDLAVNIGGSKLLPGPIENVVTSNDSVFVSIKECDGDTCKNPGVFHSQPILDHHGRIIAWTDWQRVAGATKPTLNIGVAPGNGSFTVLEQNNDTFSLRKTLWKKENTIFTVLKQICDQEFSPENGGIRGYFEFGPEELNCNAYWHIVSGYNKIMITKIAQQDSQGKMHITLDEINDANNTIFTFSDYSGGPIDFATFIHNGDQKWLAVSGAKGLFILADKEGNGWGLHEEVDYSRLNQMSFYNVGSYSFVKKLMQCGNQACILTDNSLEYVVFDPKIIIGKKEYNAKKCIISQSLHGCCNDVDIFGSVVLLATSKGLFAAGFENGNVSLQWKKIIFPCEDWLKPFKLISIKSSVHSGKIRPANVYVLMSSVRKDFSKLFRLCIETPDSDSDSVIQVFHEQRRSTQSSTPFMEFGGHRHLFYGIGSHFYIGRSRTKGRDPFIDVQAGFYGLGTGAYINNIRFKHRLSLDIESGSYLGGIFYSQATGSLILYGDFGLRIHE